MIKFAVIGQGHIGKRHAEMIRQNGDSELVAVCDSLPKEEIGWTEDEVPFFQSVEDLLATNIKIDVVNICTPNAYHADLALKCLAKRHHVVVEKPIL